MSIHTRSVASFSRIVTKVPDEGFSYTNLVYVDEKLFNSLSSYRRNSYVSINGYIFSAKLYSNASYKEIYLSSCIRALLKVQLGETISVSQVPYELLSSIPSSEVKYDNLEILTTGEELELHSRSVLDGHLLHLSQTIPFKIHNQQIKLTVVGITALKHGETSYLIKGFVTDSTKFDFGDLNSNSGIFKSNFCFEELGIGGLDNEFDTIFRRAFISRTYPLPILKQLGISHVKGLILYGPPGTGKTLIARQISKALNCSKPKIVNGPEIMSRFFGQSEENVRELFKDAEAEYERKKDASSLHIIIFDEIDSICQRRGMDTSGTAARDSIVTQLLSKIDGVDSLNNILLIGMTNRIDMIDEALLRPGRFEVQIEIGLPNEQGRQDILKIHTKTMRESKRLSHDVNLEEIASRTKNFTGAELEGLIKAAVSFASQRHIDVDNPSVPRDIENIIVERNDFLNALADVTPAFGADSSDLNSCLIYGIIPFGDRFVTLMKNLTMYAQKIIKSNKIPLLSVLLEGTAGSGKTALVAHMAKEVNFPFLKLVTPDQFIGLSELSRVNAISKIFDDAHKSPLSMIVLDGIERLIDYSPVGPRFSNTILQALIVLIKKPPPNGRRIFLVATTSEEAFMRESKIYDSFNAVLKVPLVTGDEEIAKVLKELRREEADLPEDEIEKIIKTGKVRQVGIKHMIVAVEMASERRTSEFITAEDFVSALEDCPLDYYYTI